MYTQIKKPEKNKNRVADNSGAQKKNSKKRDSGLYDGREQVMPDFGDIKNHRRIVQAKITTLKNKSQEKRFLVEMLNKYEKKYGQETVSKRIGLLNQESYENEAHFEAALEYDLSTKAAPGKPLTLQELYMTEYGWAERKEGKQNIPKKSVENLKVYRTMKVAEWEAVRDGNDKALSGHLGDYKEALNYLFGKSVPKVMVEFPIKIGAERELFSAKSMALPRPKKAQAKLTRIKDVLKKEGLGDGHPEASANEGLAPNLVGIKLESHGEAGFSFGIGGGSSPNEFMKYVDKSKMGIVGASNGVKAETFPIKTGKELPSTVSSMPEKTQAGNPQARLLAEGLSAYIGNATLIPHIPGAQEPDILDLAAIHDVEGDKKSLDKKKKNITDAENWKISDHGGGGDCLFLALNGSSDRDQAQIIREQVVAHQHDNDQVGQGVVDNDLGTMLRMSPHPELNAIADSTRGRQGFDRNTYYRLMAFQGTWGGREEVRAFSELRHVIVHIIERNGQITRYVNGANGVAVDQLPADAFNENNVVLYKTPNHWQRVDGPAQ